MEAALRLGAEHPPGAVCQALGVARSSYYRHRERAGKPPGEPVRPTPARALDASEREKVLECLHSPRFVDQAPAAVHAQLLEEGTYLCSTRTMYRILAAAGENRERRRQLTHPAYEKPELLATAPNRCWSWDITKLRGPVKWTYYYLYVILDIYSRYAVGWMVSTQESAALSKVLIAASCAKQRVEPDQLILHADRGAPMKAKALASFLADLGVAKSHSRPHVSNDNPYSEAHFKTLKYRPEFPSRFGSLQDARAFCQEFFRWYNTAHRHSGIAWHTPEQVHHGTAERIRALREATLAAAWLRHPERFPNGKPTPPALPEAVWINRPTQEES